MDQMGGHVELSGTETLNSKGLSTVIDTRDKELGIREAS